MVRFLGYFTILHDTLRFLSVALFLNTSWKISNVPLICCWEPDLYIVQEVLHTSMQELEDDRTNGIGTSLFITLSNCLRRNQKFRRRFTNAFYKSAVTFLPYFPTVDIFVGRHFHLELQNWCTAKTIEPSSYSFLNIVWCICCLFLLWQITTKCSALKQHKFVIL